MKKYAALFLLLSVVWFVPSTLLAQQEPVHSFSQDSEITGISLGKERERGVVASVYLKDPEGQQRFMPNVSHQFFVFFKDITRQKPISQGMVALKVKDPFGNVTQPTQLEAKEGGFAGGVSLTQSGDYELTIGSKLEDGKKRQYRFFCTVE